MRRQILSNGEVRAALYLDADFDKTTLSAYALAATSYIEEKTGYDFAQELSIEPLAIEAAKMFVRQLHFNAAGNYNREHNYLVGIGALIETLQDMAKRKIKPKCPRPQWRTD